MNAYKHVGARQDAQRSDHAGTRLNIAPHADDEVLGCGGLLAKYPNECVAAVCCIPSQIRGKKQPRQRRYLAPVQGSAALHPLRPALPAMADAEDQEGRAGDRTRHGGYCQPPSPRGRKGTPDSVGPESWPRRARVPVLGVPYKPDVEELREPPALEIIAAMTADGAEVACHDPWCPTAPDGQGGTLMSLMDPRDGKQSW